MKYGWIYVTDLNTINGPDFEEMDIKKFLKMLDKKTRQYKLAVDEDFDFELTNYDAFVKSVSDNGIFTPEKDAILFTIRINNGQYQIDTTNHPYLTKQLELLEARSSEFSEEKMNYCKLQYGNGDADIASAKKYLMTAKKIARRTLITEFIKGFWMSIFLFVSVILCSVGYLMYSEGIVLLGMIASFVSGIIVLCHISSNYEFPFPIKDFIRRVKLNSIINRNLRRIKRMLSKNKSSSEKIKMDRTQENIAEEYSKDFNKVDEELSSVDNKKKYKDGILNYMDNIKKAANMLDNNTGSEILEKLLVISDDYIVKRKELHDNGFQELVNDDKEKIMMKEIIDKLVDLELEVAKAVKQKEFYSFKRDIERNIAETKKSEGVVQESGHKGR